MSNDVTTTAPPTLRQLIGGESMRKQFAMALPKVMPLDSFVRGILTTLNKIPELQDCAQDTVLAGCMTAASLGLPIDPVLGRAYLIPFNDNKRGCKVAQFVIGYKGYVDLFYRSGQASGIQAEAVYEKDHFNYQHGLEPKLEHVPSEESDRGKLRYAYAVASLKGGGKVWKVLNRSQVMKAKAYSRGSDSKYSPWQTNEGEMWAKTAIRALSDLIPLSPELQQHISAIDTSERDFANAIDVSTSATVSGRFSKDDSPLPNHADAIALAKTMREADVLKVMESHSVHTIADIPAADLPAFIEALKKQSEGTRP